MDADQIRQAASHLDAYHASNTTDLANQLRALANELERDTTYNGWSNYETWCVNLWISNDQGSYNDALAIASEIYDDAAESIQVRDGIWTIEQARRFNLADAYKEWINELHYNSQPENHEANMFDDLTGSALAGVDWNEIAEAWLESVVEQRDYEATR